MMRLERISASVLIAIRHREKPDRGDCSVKQPRNFIALWNHESTIYFHSPEL